MTTLVEHADALDEILRDLATLTLAQLAAFWRTYNDTPNLLPLMEVAVPELLAPTVAASATVTAQWYNELAPTLDFQAAPVIDLPVEKVAGTIRWALYAPGTADPLSRLSGAATRWVYDASRETVVANAEAETIGYVRHARPDACAFCRMLATRQDLYTSAESAGRVVGRGKAMSESDRKARARGEERGNRGRFAAGGQTTRGTRKLGDRYHDFCRCRAVPVRAGTVYQPPAYVEAWTEEYNDAFDAVPDGTSYEDNQVLKAVLKNMRAANSGSSR